MGCCGNSSKQIQYKQGLETRTIPVQQAKTLERWTLGAAARIKVLNMKRRYMRAITELPKPTLRNQTVGGDPDRRLCLLPMNKFIDYQRGDAKNYMWDCYFTDVSETNNGSIEYRGQRLKKQMKIYEGLGELRYADGSFYQGFTRNRKYNGRGRLTYSNGDVYQGNWVNGKPQGNGVFVSPSFQTLYDGDWYNGEKHGNGREQVYEANNIVTYVGQFQAGSRSGHGQIYSDNSDSTYTGEFVNGLYHGEGKLREGRRTFDGIFRNGEFHEGKMLFDDNQTYESYSGGFRNMKMHGQGTLHFTNSNVYIGGFENDQRHGMGYLLDYENTSKVREEWVKGKRINFVKTASTPQDLDEHLQNEGYYHQNQKSPMKKGTLGKARASIKSVATGKVYGARVADRFRRATAQQTVYGEYR